MQRVKIKPMKRIVANYVLSTARGMFNTAQHWMERGYSPEHAIDNAWNYGFGMLRAGVGDTLDWAEAENYFRQLATIANLLADKCAEAQRINEQHVKNL